jgi:hypothetical protein
MNGGTESTTFREHIGTLRLSAGPDAADGETLTPEVTQ